MSTGKPGQKYATPTPGNGDRVFYESLLKQRCTSEMAQDWCLNHGIMSQKKSKKLLEIVTERKRKQRTGVGGSALSSKQKPTTSHTPPKKKKTKVKREDIVLSADI